ncbi:MAG: dipeptidyl-peptidase 3 family protein, partial [Thermoanaerobaculia bacterium]
MRIHLLCLAGLALAACAGPADDPAAAGADQPKAQAPEIQIVPDIEQRLAKFSPTPLQADLSALSPEDRHVLDLLVQAARQMDEIFLRQVWTGNPELRDKVQSWTDKNGKAAVAAREFFEINAGPWDRLDGFKPFLGDKPHPEGAGYYPEDITKQEFESWVEKHAADKERFTSGTTVIRRDGTGLKAVPYSQEYRQWLQPAAKLLRQAAAATSNASLKRFLELRATAFETDDYYESDVAWMDLDAPVEVTIGPYETYEDTLFGYKAAFEAFVTVNLPKESAALTRYKERLPWLEGNLPIPDKDKNPNRGTESPIRVVDTVFTAGDTKAGVQTLAFNLPN